MKKPLLSSLLASVLFASAAAAEPLYSVSARIAINGSDADQFQTLTGSFFLSDPQITYNMYGTSSHHENLFEYDLSEFRFSSSLLSGSGNARLWMKQHDYRDRYFRPAFDGFTYTSGDGDSTTWVMTTDIMGTQTIAPLDVAPPGGFRVDSFVLRSDSGIAYRVAQLTATRAVPEPSSLMLMLVGLGGFAVRRCRQYWDR